MGDHIPERVARFLAVNVCVAGRRVNLGGLNEKPVVDQLHSIVVKIYCGVYDLTAPRVGP